MQVPHGFCPLLHHGHPHTWPKSAFNSTTALFPEHRCILERSKVEAVEAGAALGEAGAAMGEGGGAGACCPALGTHRSEMATMVVMVGGGW